MGMKMLSNGELKSFIQAATIASWQLSFAFGGFLSLIIIFYLYLYTWLWLIILPYFVWMYADRNTPFTGGRRIEALRNSNFWKNYREYFPARMVKTHDLNPNKNYLFVVHPHGILCYNGVSNLGNENGIVKSLFPHHTFYGATLNMNFYIPFFRELLLGTGSVSVSKESLLWVLDPKKKGNVMVLVVGGAAESLMSKPKEYRLFLKSRMGFVKIALMSGCSLVPVFGFGEVDLFDVIPSPPGSFINRMQKLILKVTGVGFCLPRGRGPLRALPYKKPVTTVVGEPIDLPHIENPKEEEVKHYHNIYIERLKKLFYENRDKYLENSENIELVIE